MGTFVFHSVHYKRILFSRKELKIQTKKKKERREREREGDCEIRNVTLTSIET